MRISRFTQFACSTLIAAILLAAMPAGFALAGDCDGTAAADVVVCSTDPTVPDTEVGLGLGDDTFTIDDSVFATSVTGDGLEDGTVNTGNGGNDTLQVDGLVLIVIGDSTNGDGGDDSITVDGFVLGVIGDGSTGDGGNDTIIVNGAVTDVIGDGAGDGLTGNGGNDTIVINGQVDFVTGDDVDGDGGDDIIVINGVVYFDVTGDCAPNGDGGDDQITVNGDVVGEVIGDCAGGNGGNDTIIINGVVVEVLGDDVDGNGGDDLIVINGEVLNDVTGDCTTTGDGGDDHIVVNGEVGGDVLGDCVGGVGGDDTVTIGDGAIIGGLLDGEDGFDTLQFDAITQEDLNALGLDPAGGNITIGGITYTWANFESLIGLLVEIAERLGLRVLFNANNLLATADAEGMSIYAEHGRIAYISFATAAELGVGESQIFQTGNAAGWYVSVSNVGAGPNGNSEFQVSIFNPSGTMVGQFNYFN
jgi:hypothetical protein